MKLLDTKIVIYALGRPHLYKVSCQRLFQDIADSNANYIIDTELLQEILYIYTSRAERPLAFQVFDRLTQIFPEPIAMTPEELRQARILLGLYPTLSPRDAIHVAVVLTQGLEGLVTTDRSLGQIGGIVCFDPLLLYPA